MNKPSLMQLAKQGNTDAIASVMNYLLQQKEVNIKAALNSGILEIIAEMKQSANEEQLKSSIHSVVSHLAIVSANQLKIYGKLLGSKTLAWYEEYNIASNTHKLLINDSEDTLDDEIDSFMSTFTNKESKKTDVISENQREIYLEISESKQNDLNSRISQEFNSSLEHSPEKSIRDFSLQDLLDKAQHINQNALKELGQCNVLVIGKTGIGKSTLLNTVFGDALAAAGVGHPITQGIKQYKRKDYPITIYDTPGLELSGEQIKQVKQEVSDLIDQTNQLNEKKHIHAIWYCINHGANRFEKVEEEWIISLAEKNISIILVLTQSPSKQGSEFYKFLQSKKLPVKCIVPVLAEPKKVHDDFPPIESHGLSELVEATFLLLPEIAKKSFAREQKVSVECKAKEAFLYVTAYAAGTFGVGFSPIPFSDAPILAAIQITMLTHITNFFGIPFNREFITAVISAIGGQSTMALIGKSIVSNLLKFLPGIGTTIGGFISGSTAATLTLALGLAYIEALKIYTTSEMKGIKIPFEDLQNIFIQQYNFFIKSGKKTLRS